MTYPAVQLRRIARRVNGGTPTPAEDNWSGGIPWATPIDLGARDGRNITTTARTLTELGVETSSSIVPPNSVLVSTRAPIGYVSINTVPMAFNQGCRGLVPKDGVEARFLAYAMKHLRPAMDALGTGTTFKELSSGAMGTLQVPMPHLATQRRIADFLDQETAQIDAMIAKQEELIELLGERRSAVIAHAVTKGLNPDARMKDSGVEWLGEVPDHWKVSRFRREMEVSGGQVDPRDSPWDDMILIAPNHVESHTGRILSCETAREQGADSGKYLVREGQIIYSKIRPGLNKVCLAPLDCLCSADMYAMSSLKGDDHRFLMYYMLAQPFHWFATQMSMRVKMPKVNRDELGDAPWLRPPIAEQYEIARHLDKVTNQIDETVKWTEESVRLMRERRTALISDAVTGRLDIDTYGRTQEEIVA